MAASHSCSGVQRVEPCLSFLLHQVLCSFGRRPRRSCDRHRQHGAETALPPVSVFVAEQRETSGELQNGVAQVNCGGLRLSELTVFDLCRQILGDSDTSLLLSLKHPQPSVRVSAMEHLKDVIAAGQVDFLFNPLCLFHSGEL